MGRILIGFIVVALVAGVATYLLSSLGSNRQTTQSVRRKDLKETKRDLAEAERLISKLQGYAISNSEFQPHLSGIVLTDIQKYSDEKHQKAISE